jgi:hypothetical protein
MNKKILIIGLSVVCMLSAEKLMGAGDSHRKSPGLYDILPVEKGKVTAKSARMLAHALSNADNPRKSRRKKRNLSAVHSACEKTSSVESAQRLATAKRMFNDVVGACKPYAVPVFSMCLIKAAGAVILPAGGADLDCVQAMQPVNNCVRSIHDYYINCWGGSMGVSAGILNPCEAPDAQYNSACFDNFVISPDLYQCASICSEDAFETTVNVGDLHQKSVELVEQIKADTQYLESQKGMEPKDDKYWDVLKRRTESVLVTLPKTRDKFDVTVQLLLPFLYSCDSK